MVTICAAGWQLRLSWLAAQERKLAMSRQTVKPLPAPTVTTSKPAGPVSAAAYSEIAQKMLWSHDRNSQVIMDPPKPAAPPKPLPALPAVHGVMDIGDGPIVVMSDKPGARHRGVRPGEKIGEFKLISANNEELVLGWEDRTVKKKLGELIDRGGDSAPGQAQAGAQAAPAAAVAAAPPPAAAPAKAEPGVKLTEGISSCQTNDPSPAGTVVNGMRKVIRQTPFGPSCIWEAVK